MGGVIELDPAVPWEPPEPPSAPRRVPRRLPAVVVAVVVLVTVTAAVPPVRRDPVLSLREANTTLRFGPDDAVWVMTQRTRSGRLQVYPPGQTRPLWTVNFPGAYPVPYFLDDEAPLDRDLVMLTVFDADPSGAGDGDAVQVRDAHTGQLRWTRPGLSLLGFGTDVAILTDRQTSAPADGPGRVVEAVDRRTGRSRWTRTLPPDVVIGWGGDTVVELAPDGRVRLVDTATGTARREFRIALAGQPFLAHVDDGQIVVYQDGDRPDEQFVTGHDVATGAERWRRAGLPDDRCGDRWSCVGEPGRLTVTDVASGLVRYEGRSDQNLIRGDRLIVSAMPFAARPAVTEIYDLNTGRRAHALRGWTLAGFGKTSNLVVQQLSGSGLLVADLDVDTGGLTMLGRTTGWTGTATCFRGVRYVGCHGTSGVRVWRWPSG